MPVPVAVLIAPVAVPGPIPVMLGCAMVSPILVSRVAIVVMMSMPVMMMLIIVRLVAVRLEDNIRHRDVDANLWLMRECQAGGEQQAGYG